MPINETDIELLARAMIERHGAGAAKAAVARLNKMIDRGDWVARERWACVVHTIHVNLGIGPAYSAGDRSIARGLVAHVAWASDTVQRRDFPSGSRRLTSI
jgi:hypothetical protein